MTPTLTINIINAVEPTTAFDSNVGVARWLVHPVDIRLVGGSNPGSGVIRPGASGAARHPVGPRRVAVRHPLATRHRPAAPRHGGRHPHMPSIAVKYAWNAACSQARITAPTTRTAIDRNDAAHDDSPDQPRSSRSPLLLVVRVFGRGSEHMDEVCVARPAAHLFGVEAFHFRVDLRQQLLRHAEGKGDILDISGRLRRRGALRSLGVGRFAHGRSDTSVLRRCHHPDCSATSDPRHHCDGIAVSP